METADLPVKFDDVTAARERLSGLVEYTPCSPAELLSERLGLDIYCKLEYLQRTGSFKERGACNALLLLNEAQRREGVVTASAGNHALAVAYHARRLGIPALVVMPRFAPMIKIATCRQMGAEVLLHGDNIGEARETARAFVETGGRTYIHGYDDPAVIAGAGTLGLEILEQTPGVQAILVPVGGAGLIAGIGLVVKKLRPEVEIIGIEPNHAASLAASFAAGHPTAVTLEPTVADGLAVPRVGENAFAIARQAVDRCVTVSEDEIALAMLRLLELEKGVVEGAGATPLAALLSGKLPGVADRRLVLVLAGGNVDPTVLVRVVDRGLVADGRLCRFTAQISDRPGGLADFARLVATSGASIQQVSHDRIFTGVGLWAVEVDCVVETEDPAHAAQLFQILRDHGMLVSVADAHYSSSPSPSD